MFGITAWLFRCSDHTSRTNRRLHREFRLDAKAKHSQLQSSVERSSGGQRLRVYTSTCTRQPTISSRARDELPLFVLLAAYAAASRRDARGRHVAKCLEFVERDTQLMSSFDALLQEDTSFSPPPPRASPRARVAPALQMRLDCASRPLSTESSLYFARPTLPATGMKLSA